MRLKTERGIEGVNESRDRSRAKPWKTFLNSWLSLDVRVMATGEQGGGGMKT